MAGIAGTGVRGVAEVGDRRRQGGFQVENGLAMAIEAGIGGEYRLIRRPRMCALRHAWVAANALETQDQVGAVGEVVWLRRESDSREQRRPGSTE